MRKLYLLILLISTIALTACAQRTPAPDGQVETTSQPALAQEEPAAPTIDPAAVKMECQVVSISPTPGPTQVSMFPPPQEDDWILGDNEDATLTITEYSDFQCPYCAMLAADLKALHEKYPDDVRVVFRHFPLQGHPLALAAAHATEAAGQQGQFFKLHDRIFAGQQEFAGMTEDQFKEWVVGQAEDLGLDKAKFVEAMDSQEVADKVKEAQDHGLAIGIPGTPLVLVNGQQYQGPRDAASLEAILGLLALEDRQFTACPPMVIDPQKEYTATVTTEKGDFVIQLFGDKAPLAVNSFVFLARQGWFDNITFHRVLPGFVAQSGDPSGTGMGGPGYYFKNEISDLKYDKAGLLGMANAGPDSNGSQFFITYQATPDLDGSYTIFGEVIEGMDVVEKLTARDPAQTMDLPPGDQILKIEIKEK